MMDTATDDTGESAADRKARLDFNIMQLQQTADALDREGARQMIFCCGEMMLPVDLEGAPKELTDALKEVVKKRIEEAKKEQQ